MKFIVKALNKYSMLAKEVFSFDNEEDARKLSLNLESISDDCAFFFSKEACPPENDCSTNYYFYAGESSEYERVCVLIVKIDYWNKYHRVDDKFLKIQEYVPSGIWEESEGMFFSDLTLKETKNKMRKFGFKEHGSFSVFARNSDPFELNDIL